LPYPTTGTAMSKSISDVFIIWNVLSIFKWCLLGGTKWLHKQRPCTDDASCITRLRSCGAMLVGKTNMHELGAGTSGINPHYG
jgi:Asp-tRNA(Asn)/Glu-tRNA(Gln) amidotransferase A subunit family amidase